MRKLKTPESKLGGREPRATTSGGGSNGTPEMNAFELFCACYLGITENNNFRKQSTSEVARRFKVSDKEITKALSGFGLDQNTVRQSAYDMSLAELDMKVAPRGMDKKELARVLYEDFLEATPKSKELIEEAEGDKS